MGTVASSFWDCGLRRTESFQHLEFLLCSDSNGQQPEEIRSIKGTVE